MYFVLLPVHIRQEEIPPQIKSEPLKKENNSLLIAIL